MSEKTMPAAEAEAVAELDDESFAYELAFHILPTVAEEEVPTVFADLKAVVEKAGGEIFAEESPERFDLAYELVKHLEGKNRKFQSAYFGWVRFRSTASAVEKIAEEMEANTKVLRHLLIRMTRTEEENPFKFHEALRDQKMVTTVEESEVVPDFTSVKSDDKKETAKAEAETEKEEAGEVDDEELEKALKEKEV